MPELKKCENDRLSHAHPHPYSLERQSKKGRKFYEAKQTNIKGVGSFGKVLDVTNSHKRATSSGGMIQNNQRKYNVVFLSPDQTIENFIANDMVLTEKKPTLSFIVTNSNEYYLIDRSYKVFTAQGATWNYKQVLLDEEAQKTLSDMRDLANTSKNQNQEISFESIEIKVKNYLGNYANKKEVIKFQIFTKITGEKCTEKTENISNEIDGLKKSGVSHIKGPFIFAVQETDSNIQAMAMQSYFAFKMPLIDEAMTLKDLIDDQKWDENKKTLGLQQERLTKEDVQEITQAGLQALKYIHERSIIHRDIKPDNIMVKRIDGKWGVVLLDFGLAVQTNQSAPVAGSLLYVASQALQDGAVSWLPEHDLFSFAVSMLELLGAPPWWFELKANLTILLGHRRTHLDRFDLTAQQINTICVFGVEGFKVFFTDMLANPPVSAQVALDALGKIDQQPIQSPSSSSIQKPRRPSRTWGKNSGGVNGCNADTTELKASETPADADSEESANRNETEAVDFVRQIEEIEKKVQQNQINQIENLSKKTETLAQGSRSFVTDVVEAGKTAQEKAKQEKAEHEKLMSQTKALEQEQQKTMPTFKKINLNQTPKKSWFASFIDWFKSLFFALPQEEEELEKKSMEKIVFNKQNAVKQKTESSLFDNLCCSFSGLFAEAEDEKSVKAAASPSQHVPSPAQKHESSSFAV